MNTSVVEAGGAMPEAIVYMPKGERRIYATVDGKAGWAPLQVTRSAADVLQRDLELIQADVAAGKRSRPVVYFDHKTGPAAGIPKRFTWDDKKGVLLELDWTGAGEDAVMRQNYSYFSPSFRVGLSTGEVLGLHRDATEVGSLVNRPAIEDIGQIAASLPEGGAYMEPAENELAVNAANPYGCNQYGHGFKREHEGHSSQKTFGFANSPSVFHPKAKELKKGQDAAKEAYDRYKEANKKINARYNGRDEDYDEYGIEDVYKEEEKAWKEAVLHPSDDTYHKEALAATEKRREAVEETGESDLRSKSEQRKHEKEMRKADMEWEREKKAEARRKMERAKKELPAARRKRDEVLEANRKAADEYRERTGKHNFFRTKEGRAAAAEYDKANRLVEEYERDLRGRNVDAAYGEEVSDIDAANPYGCNQYGEGWKAPHNGTFTSINEDGKKEVKKEGTQEREEKVKPSEDDERNAKIVKLHNEMQKLQKEIDTLGEETNDAFDAYRWGDKPYSFWAEKDKRFNALIEEKEKKAQELRTLRKERAGKVKAAHAGEDLSPRGGVAEDGETRDNASTAKGGGFNTMDKELKKRLGLEEEADSAAVSAAMVKCMDELDELKKKHAKLQDDKKTVDAELKAAKADQAEAFVNDLKARGVIAPKDEARITAARALFEKDAASARALFDGVQLNKEDEGSVLAARAEGAAQDADPVDVADGCQQRIRKLMGF